MASEYTLNRRYPLYTDTDKPNLRDQYNGAIREIDADMKIALEGSAEVVDALGSGFDAQHTVRMEIEGEAQARQQADSDIDAKLGTGFSSQSTVRQAIDSEATTRQQADSALDAKIGTGFSDQNTVRRVIDSEATTRQQADAALSQSISDVSADVQSIGSVLGHRTFLCFGDSYGNGTYRTESGYANSQYGWLNWFTNRVPSMTGATVLTNLGSIVPGNSGFASSSTFLAQLNDLLSRGLIPDPDDVTDIVALAGTNDDGVSYQSIVDGVTAFIDRAREVFKYAKIKIGYISCRMNYYNACVAYQDACYLRGVEYLSSLRNLFFKREFIGPDGGHPTDAAYNVYKNYIVEAAFNGNIQYCIRNAWTFGNMPTGVTDSNIFAESVVTPTSHKVIWRAGNPGGQIPLLVLSDYHGTADVLDIPVENLPLFTQSGVQIGSGTLRFTTTINSSEPLTVGIPAANIYKGSATENDSIKIKFTGMTPIPSVFSNTYLVIDSGEWEIPTVI